MRLQIIPELGIRQRIENLLDALIDALASIKDYFLFKHVTLFEAFFFTLAASRAVWFAFNGVEQTVYDYYFKSQFWIAMFSAITLTHLAGFAAGWLSGRLIAMYAHGSIWLFMCAIALLARPHDPAIPTFLLYTFFSVIVIARLSRESQG